MFLTKKQLNNIITTKKQYIFDYVIGTDKENDIICVNYLEEEKEYIVGTYGKSFDNDYETIEFFTNKKKLINYLYDLEIKRNWKGDKNV